MKEVRPLIGIPAVPTYDDEQDAIMALYQDYKDVVYQNGGIPFLINPIAKEDYVNTRLRNMKPLTTEAKELYYEMTDMCAGIIIPGGYKIHLFAEEIAKYAIRKDIPILGVCLGMQLLAKIENSKNVLVRNETPIEHKQRGEQYVHDLNIVDGTKLHEILQKDTIRVNSVHRFHISHVNHFKVNSYSEDGLIEGIELPGKKFVIGVQWHPEKMMEYDENANRLWRAFMEEAKKEKIYRK